MITERKLWELISLYRSDTCDSKLNGTFLTADNITRCLTLFDNIIQFLGVFKEIANELKIDITEAIFSHQLTANENEINNELERIPYFLLYRNLLEIQKTESFEYKESKENLTKEILLQLENFNVLNEINQEKENECLKFEKEIIENRLEINHLQLEMQNLKDLKQENENHMQNIIDNIEKENNSFKEELYRQNIVSGNLQVYKDAHDHLDQSFMSACQDICDEEKQSKDPFNKKSNLEMEIKTIVTMTNDLITMENLMLDDFDKRIMEFKQDTMDCKYSKDDTSDIPNAENKKTNELVTNTLDNFNKSKSYFQNEFSQLQTESLVLQSHQAVLINDWSTIHESELENASKARRVPNKIKASFIVDDQIMSKYSAMIYFSNDGETFYNCKEVRYCESCGTKSVICPHNTCQKEKIIKLPTGSTHIKIQRPEVKISSKYAKYFIPNSSVLIEESQSIVSNEERKQSSRKSFRSSLLSSMSSNDSENIVSFDSLLEDFENRTHMRRIAPRKLNESHVLSIIEDFWVTVLNEDEYDSQQSEITTILDKLYLFFLDRYTHEKAAMFSLYDFLTSTIEMALSSQIIQLFCLVLISNIDSSVIRYLFHLVDCVECAVLKNEDDFRCFISHVYPFLNEDDIDGIVLSYISHSENVFDRFHVFEFIIFNFLKQRDPRFTWVKSEVAEFKTSIPGFYTFKEFQVLLESVTSLPNKKLSLRLFKELAILYTDDGFNETAPISKIFEIVAFLSFLEVVETIKQLLRDKYKNTFKYKKEPMRWSFSRLTNLAYKLLREY